MVQLTFMDSASKTCHCCRSRTNSRNTGSTSKPRAPTRSCPHGSKRGRTRTVSPRSEKAPYSALRPLDEALPGELDLEGWDSDDDRDNRGPETCLSPSPVPERKKGKEQITVSIGSAPLRPPMITAGSPFEGRLTGILADGGAMARSGGQAREHQVSESPHPNLPSTNKEKVTAGGTLTRSSSSASSGSDFGPFSALRSFDDAEPRVAGEGWDSDADWDYGGPEPCCADVDGRAGTKRRRRDNPASNVTPRRSKRLLDSSALRHTFGPPTHFQVLRAREGATGESGQSTASLKAKQSRRKDSTSDVAAPLRRSKRRRDHRAPRQHSWVALGSPRSGGEGRSYWGKRAKYSQPHQGALTPPHSCRRGPSRWRYTNTVVLPALV
jgi:hypothetical protein